ncbi:MAG TPA: methyltransferase [Acidimicrobiales bacterium]|nr:methyltransferase [Acidimicrobiales bacterium]
MNRRSPTALSPQSVLGVPFLPPGAVTTASNRAREVVNRLHARMAPPPVRILEGIFGMLDHRVLVALCAAGVPDALTDKIEPIALAKELGVDPVALERLLRFAATRGWVRIDRRGRVRPTAVTAFLRRDHPGGWRAWVDFAGGDEVVAAVGSLTLASEPTDAFAAANGTAFFDWMSLHPERWVAFDRAMAAGGRMHALTLDAALDWSAARRVCDVGGGTGELLASLLDLQPHLAGSVFDLPDVVERAVRHDRLTAIGGDAFREVPGGFDTYLLVNVLHDWSDDDAARILGRVAAAAAGSARIVVVDNERTATPRHDLAVSADVLMAALTNGGRERSTSEFAALGRRCDLHLSRSVRLASGDLAHEFVTSRP